MISEVIFKASGFLPFVSFCAGPYTSYNGPALRQFNLALTKPVLKATVELLSAQADGAVITKCSQTHFLRRPFCLVFTPLIRSEMRAAKTPIKRLEFGLR